MLSALFRKKGPKRTLDEWIALIAAIPLAFLVLPFMLAYEAYKWITGK